MDTSEFDSKIKTADDEIESLRGQMDQTCSQYIQVCTNFFQLEFQKRVEAAITGNPAVAQGLGLEKLKALKAELKDLVDRVPRIVSEHLDKQDIWEHRTPLPEGLEKDRNRETDLRIRAGSKARDELRSIIGYVGQLILKYGLDEGSERSEWEKQGKGLPKYRYSLPPYGSGLNESLETYKGLFERFIQAHFDLKSAQAAKEQAIAKDLWNQA